MSLIRIHLDSEEYTPVVRLAERLHVSPEDLAYCALNRLMMAAEDPKLGAEILDIKSWRGENLPRWADHGRCVHIYEAMHDIQPDGS